MNMKILYELFLVQQIIRGLSVQICCLQTIISKRFGEQKRKNENILNEKY